jgi:hypothetical protein
MSLEQALERNTEMMKDLIRALEGFQPAAAAPQEAPPVPKLHPKAIPEITPVALTPIASAGPSAAEPAPLLTIDYAQVAAAITSTFKIDRAKVVAALGKFGAAKGPQLKVEDYAAFLQELAA